MLHPVHYIREPTDPRWHSTFKIPLLFNPPFNKIPIYVDQFVESVATLFRDVERLVPWLPHPAPELVNLLNSLGFFFSYCGHFITGAGPMTSEIWNLLVRTLNKYLGPKLQHPSDWEQINKGGWVCQPLVDQQLVLLKSCWSDKSSSSSQTAFYFKY